MIITLLIISILIQVGIITLILLDQSAKSAQITNQKLQLKQKKVGHEYNTCEYCHRYLPEVVMIDGHMCCTNQICRNHVGA